MSEDTTAGGAPPVQETRPQPAARAGDERSRPPDRTPVEGGSARAAGPLRAGSGFSAGEQPQSGSGTSTGSAPAAAGGAAAHGSARSRPDDNTGDAPEHGAPTTVLPAGGSRPQRPSARRAERGPGDSRGAARGAGRPAGRRRARLVLQRIDAWSVFLFSLVASVCLGVVLLVAVAALYAVLSSLGVLASLNGLLGEVAGGPGEVVEPFITAGRVLGGTAVLAAVDVVLLTALATLGSLLYNLCASLTGGIEVQLGERE